MKLKQDVESSWECPFVSVSEGRSGAQQASCNVKEKRGSVESPTLTQQALAFFLVPIHKTTHKTKQRISHCRNLFLRSAAAGTHPI
ncbi:MAG: hypothetical protein DRP27_04760, partial [Thermotogae bacterium]